jgi:hypothetical protein
MGTHVQAVPRMQTVKKRNTERAPLKAVPQRRDLLARRAPPAHHIAAMEFMTTAAQHTTDTRYQLLALIRLRGWGLAAWTGLILTCNLQRSWPLQP